MMTVMLLFTACLTAAAQDDVTSDDSEVGSDSPAFVPMVKVGKALVDNDSIQYVELNTLYVYPKLTFKDERQRQAYNRLVANIKKVLPIAKEVNSIIVETYEYLQTLPDKKSKDEHMKRVEKGILAAVNDKLLYRIGYCKDIEVSVISSKELFNMNTKQL